MAVELIPATEAHAGELADTMRPEDVEEIRANSGRAPLETLLLALETNPRAMLINGDLAAMYGVAPFGGRLGSIWMLTSCVVEMHPVAFLRACSWNLPALLKGWDEVRNFIDARNLAHVRWAGWMGFEVGEPVPYGVLGLPFHPIRWRAHV